MLILIHHVHREVGLGSQKDAEIIDVLIQHEGMWALPAHREALLVSETGLLDVDVHIADCLGHADGLVLEPSGVCVGHQAVPRLKLGRDRKDARNVDIRIPAHLQLESPVALRAIPGDACGHLVGTVLRDRAVEVDILAIAPAEKLTHRHPAALAEDVPAGDVDAALHIGMALEGCVHGAVESRELSGVLAEEMRPELTDAGAYALGVGGKVEGAQRTDLTMADQAGVGFDPDDGAVEDGDRFSAAPLVGGLVEREFDAIGEDSCDFHIDGWYILRPLAWVPLQCPGLSLTGPAGKAQRLIGSWVWQRPFKTVSPWSAMKPARGM